MNQQLQHTIYTFLNGYSKLPYQKETCFGEEMQQNTTKYIQLGGILNTCVVNVNEMANKQQIAIKGIIIKDGHLNCAVHKVEKKSTAWNEKLKATGSSFSGCVEW